MIDAWERYIDAWLAAGLAPPPCFDRVRDNYQPPPNGMDGLFMGPVITANGPPPRGYHLESFIHHRGPMPLDAHLQLKLNWHAGLLEEIKVDSQVVLECLDPRIAYGASVIEFVLLERLFRYPLQPDVQRNFDSGTGVFLFEWLTEHGAITVDGARITAFDREAIYGALRSLVETIEALERCARGEDYKALARQFVHRYLRPPSQEGDRFDIPPRMRAVLDAAHRPGRELQFADLAY
ncbi:DUF6421 family protein [Acidovorax sp. NCPPB 4044]|uniref:DUF6421 family protein n=1 Tax=Acidovorax sp. NCPPB 4044 TaxID=2940490 RepID=UPI002303988C|nr:DUF6421 family protein [Acidovorax sp. NCPPB 4044]MDA8523052.1 DUF6421 family protein [Acidovorax sp. NCPPB 4044]